MNSLDDLRYYIQDNLSTLLPLVLIFFLVLGELAFVNIKILPNWRARAALTEQVSAIRQTNAAAQAAASGQSADDSALEDAQLASMQTRLAETAADFLTAEQAANILNRLYDYAALSRVEIDTLQAQAPAVETETTAYDASAVHLEASGSAEKLAEFLARIKEASLTSVQITNLQLTSEQNDASQLSMDIQIYTSLYSTGDALAFLPEIIIPTPTPTPTSAPVCDCSANVYDCRDFDTQQAAQSCYDSCGGPANDVHLLDADLNGLACESVWPNP